MFARAAYPLSLVLTFCAAPAVADWGGYAVHQGTYDWGYSAGWGSRGEANERAMFYCRQNAGADASCEVLMATTQCGGLARGSKNGAPFFATGEGAHPDAAAEAAMAACDQQGANFCQIRHSFCADDL